MIRIQTIKDSSKRLQAIQEFDKHKYNLSNAYICRFFWAYKLYTNNPILRILFFISCFMLIGTIRWIIDLFNVSKFVKDKNNKIDLEIYIKYKDE